MDNVDYEIQRVACNKLFLLINWEGIYFNPKWVVMYRKIIRIYIFYIFSYIEGRKFDARLLQSSFRFANMHLRYFIGGTWAEINVGGPIRQVAFI